jgi:hypothetical protein
MNEAQRLAIKNRQRNAVAAEPAEGPVERPPPAPPQRPMSEIATEKRPDVGPGIPVLSMRFSDRSFQLPGMQSGETFTSRTEPNGRVHAMELLRDLNCFMAMFIDPAKRSVEYTMVERAHVKTWSLA